MGATTIFHHYSNGNGLSSVSQLLYLLQVVILAFGTALMGVPLNKPTIQTSLFVARLREGAV